MMKHYISALVDNRAGVLARISGLFARRGFNIDSLAVGVTHDPAYSRVTIVVDGDSYIADQVTKQLSKLIDVRTVRQLDPEFMVQRDLVLIKVKIEPEQRGEIYDLVKIMGCEVVDITHTTLMVEFDDRPPKVSLLIDLLSKYEILEIVRTGTIAMQKGAGSLYDKEEEN
ncbi:MAG: acetolactate synthase small subunit [Clostridiales bacterium]|nr:acetolactate synthase small subunit [Clostridiales bacterium]